MLNFFKQSVEKRHTKLGKIAREDAVVDAYLARVRQFFTHAHSIPVKERKEDEHDIPDDDLARYHLIFGTRSERAVVYMNDVALNALEPYLRQFKESVRSFVFEAYHVV
jgi:uncharacterized protein YdeI (YjbR/CyaY-like superfamily)